MQPSEISDGQTKRRAAADSRQAARRRQIVDAAAELFQSRGYYATSVGDIVDQLGMSKPTIYHYFRSKEEILVYIHEMIADRLLADFAQVKLERKDPLGRLRAIFESFFAVMTDLRPHVRTFFTFFGEIEGANREQIETRRQDLSNMVEGAIKECIDVGSFRNVDARLVMLVMTGVFNWAPHWYNPAGPIPADQLSSIIFDIFLTGLQKTPPSLGTGSGG